MPFVARTFGGLPAEGDWVAMREFVPAATATLTLTDQTSIRVCSSLPGGGAGLVRADGEIWLGLQVRHDFGDPGRDLAHVIELARRTEPGTPVIMSDPGVGPRLPDLVDPGSSFEVEVHDGFDFWVSGTAAEDSELIEQATAGAAPTERLTSVEHAYWTRMGQRRYVRWVMASDEAAVLDAFARLQARGADRLGAGTRVLGMFRAHGLTVPVWEADETVADGAGPLEEPAAALADRLADALAEDIPLTAEERGVRNSLTHRQLTIR